MSFEQSEVTKGAESKASCSVCGTKLPANSPGGMCPVCLLRAGVDSEPGTELKQDSRGLNDDNQATPPTTEERTFGHYEILVRGDGRLHELGRGAMGVTYKALDVNLRCPVALKLLNPRFLGDESVRARFLREARVAARVRHPNVASVFHFGSRGREFFYAMEFVEGETLEDVIRRSGRLEVKLALEITAQVTTGLASVHKQKLVHRDIKPSNVMVSFEEGGAVAAKIIDLGLAKTINEPGTQTAISIPGGFAGTPEFASPEQFAGVPVDIRSDLYSLGVTLWRMVTGKTPFQGTPGEVMHWHHHAPLPLDQLEGVPQPVVLLFTVLLEKDPGRRFQNPGELERAIRTITGLIDEGGRITREGLHQMPAGASGARTRRPPSGPGPKKISIARLPVTGSDLFGREEDIAFLDDAWANKDANVVTIAAWAGVGKSTLVNHWLRRMATERYRSAQLVFGWSFYRQGSSGETSSADEFLDVALSWFGDPDPRLGTGWEKGERLAKLVAHRRTLLVLDGLEPLQNPPGPQEGRLREPSVQALLRELAAFNTGLCVITTRMPVADIADHEHTSALRCDLEQLSSEAGAKLLRALGVKGNEAQLRTASEEFSGHCLALTLLGSYLTDAYHGDVSRREDVSARLAHDPRQGAHARKVMESYQSWFGKGPVLAILRMLGLFDRPADEQALGALLKSPAIPGLTESLTDLRTGEWQTFLAKLRRARLLAQEDPHNPGQLDTHPLVREYFGEQLRSQQTDAWKECNRRLFHYYRTLAPQLPNSFREMEPLFSAVICGCSAGLYREALREVYISRIQRGNAYFAGKVLRATGPLLSVLVHFFEHGRWGSLVEAAIEGQSLTAEDQLFILAQAALYLTPTRGLQSPEARICHERLASLCYSLGQPLLLYTALIGQWRYSLMTDKLTAGMQIAKRVYSFAQEQDDARLMIGAHCALAVTFWFLGDFESSRQHAVRGAQIWRSKGVLSPVEVPVAHAVICQCHQALSEWHLGEIASCQPTMGEAIALAKELNDLHALAQALWYAAILAQFERNPPQVERYSSDCIELSTRHNFGQWLLGGNVLSGWARSTSGDTAQGICWIDDAIRNYRATGAVLAMPYFLALKAEALHLAGRTSEALEAINEAEAMAERFEEAWWCAELHRLRGVFLAAISADETQIKASFCAAVGTAKQQKSISLEKRAEATYAEYRLQKASAAGGQGFRLPLW
ncbi:MAG: protein kinase [Chthoniobacterales bacterium]